MHKNHHSKKQKANNDLWIFGSHACASAIENPKRTIKRVLLTKSAKEEFSSILSSKSNRLPPIEVVDKHILDSLLGATTAHQGIALAVHQLPEPDLSDIYSNPDSNSVIVVLDQVTDVHNIGAILRSCAAFKVDALILTEFNAPAETGAMAKTACGALELVPMIRAKNLVKTLEQLKKQGYWCVGMDGEAKAPLEEIKTFNRLVLVMGAEGKGIRRLTREHCDLLVKIPIDSAMESLNVSNATAIALYEASKKQL